MINYPTGIAEFNRENGGVHKYDMANGSVMQLTKAEAAKMLRDAGGAPYLLVAPKAYMPKPKTKGIKK